MRNEASLSLIEEQSTYDITTQTHTIFFWSLQWNKRVPNYFRYSNIAYEDRDA